MTDPQAQAGPINSIDADAITLRGTRLKGRTFLLGNEGGFVLYLPVEQNIRDRTLMPIKWFGASEFGRKYLEDNLVWILQDGQLIKLDRTNQTEFTSYLDRTERTFTVGDVVVRQSYFVPDRLQAFVMTIEADHDLEIAVEPEFDMRYYQAFNTDFSGYRASSQNGRLLVSNQIQGPPAAGKLDFFALIGSTGTLSIELLPESRRLRKKTYLKDEYREKLIHTAYAETHETAPDEAPIWDVYSTEVYAPARITGRTPLALIYAFGESEKDAGEVFREASRDLSALGRDKATYTLQLLDDGELETGVRDIDVAYAQVLARFDNALVARDITVHAGEHTMSHWSAIFAGNKYFLDAWKRDENISLIGLLTTNRYETVRAILDETWQFQDERTGRLPHIIRMGEPIVYYASDATLWAMRRLWQYTRMSGDRTLLEAKYSMVEHFFSASLSFVRRGLLPSGGIIDKTYLWETWEDTPYTPRAGYPVEIELLWLTVLQDLLPIVQDRNPALATKLEATLAEGRETFKLFYLDGYLADSLSYDWKPRPALTPNGYIAFALHYPLPPDLAHSMVVLARTQLAGHTGVRSLARRDWASALSKEFVADPRNIRRNRMASVGIYNYHRGIEWLWLNQFMLEGELTCGDTTTGYWEYVSGQVHSALHEGGVGGLSELYDIRGPLGADYQAWSMASFISSLHAFAGTEIDAIAGHIRVRPSLPERWPYLTCRSRIGATRFDVHAEGDTKRGQSVEVRVIDAVPSSHALEMGVRVPAGQRVTGAWLDGAAVPDDQIRTVAGCVPGADGEAWIHTDLRRRVTARFAIE